ncbi:hypothetical protein HYC85_013033 [Camellia sinensis]|uniref:Gamma tubulin complex component C-terminal domain-containing protein n=1 Tax=Camellia sinensis TaxID=4442 RepID=A0A7J7HDP8_CAMSI|nr:hypothetical protein HYC85_013033 [Camellia sinensis]
MQIVVNLVQETYEVQWPLSLVISRKALTKYQLIFRFLFHYEHVDLQLCGAWKIHQGVRAVNTKGTAISRSCLLCRSMLKFINSLLHYLTFEACFTLPLLLVLEPNWHVMHNRLQTAKSIDDVIEYHNFSLEKCITECLLLLPEVLKILDILCVDYDFHPYFNLVAVSGLRADKVIELARQRLSTIGMCFTVYIFTNLLICPMWASDELHHSTASKFQKLASCIQGILEEYFRVVNEKEKQPGANFANCKSVIHSKLSDESLANFARWEPWHGKFGFSYPWDKYLQIGDVLRDLPATIISLKGCLQSPRQDVTIYIDILFQSCVISLHQIHDSRSRNRVKQLARCSRGFLGELGESIIKMEKCRPKSLMASKLQSMRAELSLLASPSKLGASENGEGLAMASFVFLLMEIVEKVEVLAKEVEELGELADFQAR